MVCGCMSSTTQVSQSTDVKMDGGKYRTNLKENLFGPAKDFKTINQNGLVKVQI